MTLLAFFALSAAASANALYLAALSSLSLASFSSRSLCSLSASAIAASSASRFLSASSCSYLIRISSASIAFLLASNSLGEGLSTRGIEYSNLVKFIGP
jgi:hypothetical protein